MEYDQNKVAQALAKMTPEERIKYLEKLAAEAKKDLQSTEQAVKQSQELLDRNRKELLKHALLQEQKLLKEHEERKQLDEQRMELSKYLEKEGKELETVAQNAQNIRAPKGHPIVGLYTQLQNIRYNYQQQEAVDYARTTVLEELRKEVLEVLQQYKEMPDELKEIADATYRLTKELLGANAASKQKYFP